MDGGKIMSKNNNKSNNYSMKTKLTMAVIAFAISFIFVSAVLPMFK